MITKKLPFLEMWIFTETCTKNRFFQNDLKKRSFRRYVDIFGDIDKKLLLQRDLKKIPFP